MDLLGIAAVIGSFGTALAVVITSLRTNRKIEDVKHEVVTGNDRTLGQLGTATETRRVRAIPAKDRNAQERAHESWAEDAEGDK